MDQAIETDLEEEISGAHPEPPFGPQPMSLNERNNNRFRSGRFALEPLCHLQVY
jgi:hypothetical protein